MFEFHIYNWYSGIIILIFFFYYYPDFIDKETGPERVIFLNAQNQETVDHLNWILRHLAILSVVFRICIRVTWGVLPNSNFSVPISSDSETVGVSWGSIISNLSHPRFSDTSTKHWILLDSCSTDYCAIWWSGEEIKGSRFGEKSLLKSWLHRRKGTVQGMSHSNNHSSLWPSGQVRIKSGSD